MRPVSTSGGAGGASLDTLSVTAGDLTWGTITASSEKTITIGGDGAGSGIGFWLDGSGDTAAFELTKVDGVALASPHDFTGGVYYVPTAASGGSRTVTLQPLYTDGTAETMTLDIVSVTGNIDDTIDATATLEDAFLGAISTAGNSIGIFTPRDVAIDTGLSADDVTFTDLDGVEDDIEIASIHANASVDIVASGLTAPSLVNACKVNYGPLASGWPAGADPAPMGILSTLASTIKSGIIVFEITANDIDSGVQVISELWNLAGTKASNNSDSGVMFWDTNTARADHAMRIASGSWVAQTSFVNFGGGVVDTTGIQYTFAWTRDGTDVRTWLSKVGEAFGGVATTDEAATLIGTQDGIRLFNNVAQSGGTATELDMQVIAVVPFDDENNDVDLEDVHDAVA